MAVPLEQFVKQLEDSGIIAGDTLKDFIPPKASPKDAEDLAKELVRQNKLTKFQAGEVYRGNGKSLVLGNYILVEKIGAGGMGQVYKARHRVMERMVAVKVLPANVTKDQAAVARFHREVQAAAKLSHPNIVTAHDADQAGGVHFLVMECVDGTDLSALVKKNGPLPVDKAVNCILQAARGLEAAHKSGIVHRDIKPANLLLDKNGTVKILDMGLARIESGGAGPQAELTNSGMVMGTVDYMAPEQALNTKTADARADIYSLGCSLYYLLTGKATYDGDSIMAKLLAHREQQIPSVRSIRSEVPEQVEAVFRKMVAKRTDDRYQTMASVIADLEKCGTGQQSIGTQQSLGSSDTDLTNFLKEISFEQRKPVQPKPKKAVLDKNWVKRNKLLLIGAGILGVLVLLTGVLVSVRTKHGTLIVEVNEPDAEVQVISQEGWVEVTQEGEKGSITISVDPGKHRVRVTKEGFEFFTEDFEMETGGKKTITAKLVPVEEKTDVVFGQNAPLAFEAPGFDQWIKEVAVLPPEKQVQVVVTRLQELNQGFDGKETHKVEDGVVVELRFVTDNVTDISPVRALVGLKNLHCHGSEMGKGQLVNLHPLKGMALTRLDCFHTKVSDLSPLEGMPLTQLYCYGTPLSKLSPLKRMALSSLNLHDTQVNDLASLTGMPLSHLDFHNTPVSDLTPLNGMPLTNLSCSGTNVSDLSPLKNMKLTGLTCDRTAVSDLTPLKGMPLTSLQIHNTGVSDLSALKGMLLTNLRCDVTPVSDLTPLKGMPLTELVIDHTTVSDLSPLEGMPLTYLLCFATQVSDLSPLKGIPLTYLTCDFKPFRDIELLRSIKSLVTINGKPAAEFWKEVEVQQAAFDEWMKQVGGMPAEEQVQAVVKKLQDSNPEFDGKETHKVEDGVVTELKFVTDNVTDISPVRTLSGLRTLRCGGSEPGKGKLSDLSPLQGMLLTSVNCASTQVSDLSPLRGMPLTALDCYNTAVSDLSPLIGMPLAALNCAGTRVSDLAPLTGMLLGSLNCSDTHVSDLLPLKGMPLTSLDFQKTQVSDLSPLKGMSLTYLDCTGTLVSDLATLKEMKLTLLACSNTPVSDLSPLTGLKLMTLHCDFKPFRDTDLLRSIKTLETINNKPAAEFWKENSITTELDGEWLFVEGSLSGSKIEVGIGQGKDRRLIVLGNRYTLYFADATIEGSLSHDPTTSPKTLDFTPEKGGSESVRGKLKRAIYETDGATLRFCVGNPEGDRPTEFDSKPKGWSIQVYRRKSAE